MKAYQYKLQWLFPVRGGFTSTTKQNQKELYSLIKILGARSLTSIVFRNSDLKTLHNYYGMVQYSSEEADKKTIAYIKNALKENSEIMYIELFRR